MLPGMFGGAVGNVDDLLCAEDAVPDVELAELPDKCLRGVEPAADRVLGKGDGVSGGRLGRMCICPLSQACDPPGRGAPAWKGRGEGATPLTQMAPRDH